MPSNPNAVKSDGSQQNVPSGWQNMDQNGNKKFAKTDTAEKSSAREQLERLLARTKANLGKNALVAVTAPESNLESVTPEPQTETQPEPSLQLPEVVKTETDDFQPPALRPEQLPAVYEEDKQLPAAQSEEEPKKHAPLTAINAHRNLDVKERAHELAEERLNAEIQAAKGVKGAIAKVVKGSMLRSFFLYRKEKEAIKDIRNKQEGESSNLSDKEWQNLSQSTIDRFTKASRDEKYSGMVHEDEKIYNENKEATKLAKDLISDYASGKINAEKFNEDIEQVREMLKSDTNLSGEDAAEDNFFALASEARARYENNEALSDIMEGFKVVNADVRTGLKSEVHRNSIDKIVNKVEEMKNKIPGLNLIPGEAIALGVSLGSMAAQAKSRTLATVLGFGVGGIAVSAGIAAAKEGNRVAEDRNQRARERAKGLENEGESKYDKEMAETMHKLYKANDLKDAISKAKESGNPAEIMKAVLEAESIISHTDTSGVDRIGYSSAERIEDERYALDLAIAEAKAGLSKEDRENYARLRDAEMKVNLERLENEESAGDKAYKKLRHKQMAKTAAKTAATGAITMIVGQEITAAFSEKFYGIVDHLAHLKNDADAQQTLLAGLLGFKPTAGSEAAQAITETLVQSDTKLTDEQLELYKNQPDKYTVTESTSNVTINEVSGSKSVTEAIDEFGTKVHRLDWGSNGTKAFDGNELRAYYTDGKDGIVTGMFGNSGTWHSGDINFENALSEGKIKAFITLSEGTSSTPIEVTGKLVNGQIEFIPEPGSAAAACFKDGKFIGKFFEVAYDNGMNGDTQEIIPLATLVGEGLSGDIPMTVKEEVTETLYNVTEKTVTEAIENVASYMAAVPLGFSDRDNLTYSERIQEQPEAAPQPPAENPNEGFQPPAEVPGQNFQPPAETEQPGIIQTPNEVVGERTPEEIQQEKELFEEFDRLENGLDKEAIRRVEELLAKYPNPTTDGFAEWLKKDQSTRNEMIGNYISAAKNINKLEKLLTVREKSDKLDEELSSFRYWLNHVKDSLENPRSQEAANSTPGAAAPQGTTSEAPQANTEPTTPEAPQVITEPESINGIVPVELDTARVDRIMNLIDKYPSEKTLEIKSLLGDLATHQKELAEKYGNTLRDFDGLEKRFAEWNEDDQKIKNGDISPIITERLNQYQYSEDEADHRWSSLPDSTKASLANRFERISKDRNNFEGFLNANSQRGTIGADMTSLFRYWYDKLRKEEEEEK